MSGADHERAHVRGNARGRSGVADAARAHHALKRVSRSTTCPIRRRSRSRSCGRGRISAAGSCAAIRSRSSSRRSFRSPRRSRVPHWAARPRRLPFRSDRAGRMRRFARLERHLWRARGMDGRALAFGIQCIPPSSAGVPDAAASAPYAEMARQPRHRAQHSRQRARGRIDIGPLDAYWHLLTGAPRAAARRGYPRA